MLTASDHFPYSSLVVFFLLDFTFVCPVETAALGQGGAQ
jgi:alkyl hydroperoxide reductase subunit AhpC